MNNSLCRKEVIRMQKLLMLHIDKECDKLSNSANLLLSVKHSFDNQYTDVLFEHLVKEFDDISDRLGNLAVAVLKCDGNTELLKHCIEYINEMSFIVMNFTVKVMEYENIAR